MAQNNSRPVASESSSNSIVNHPFRLTRLFAVVGFGMGLAIPVLAKASQPEILGSILSPLLTWRCYLYAAVFLVPFVIGGSLLSFFHGARGTRIWIRWPVTAVFVAALLAQAYGHFDIWSHVLNDRVQWRETTDLIAFMTLPFFVTVLLLMFGVAGMLVQTVMAQNRGKKN